VHFGLRAQLLLVRESLAEESAKGKCMAVYLREIADALSLPTVGAGTEYKLTPYEEQCVREDLGATLLQGALGGMLTRIGELRQQEMQITRQIDRKDSEPPLRKSRRAGAGS